MHPNPFKFQLLTSLIVSLLAVGLSVTWSASSLGQTAKARSRSDRMGANLIRPEYYVALDFLEDGQTEQAIIGFDQAIQQSRSFDNQRGIDSVPPMVMMAECLLMQGHIGMAMEQYDAALSLSFQCSSWLSLLGQGPSGKAEPRTREIGWGSENERNADYLSISEPWPIALGGSDILLETAAGRGVAAGKLVPIDALEILRCQAIALRRRMYLLGALTSINPLSASLPQVFALPADKQFSEPIRAATNLCAALANLGAKREQNAQQLIKPFVTLSSGQDYALTSTALLSLVDIAIESNELASAEGYAMEASLSAAKAGQVEQVEEAIELWSKCVGQPDREATAVTKVLQQVSKWANGKSRLLGIRCQVELVRQAALRGDIPFVRKQASVATSLLLPKQVILPKMDAAVDYTLARIAFLDGNMAQGIQKIEESLIPYAGDGNLDVGSPSLYQLRLLTRLLQQAKVSDEVGLPILRDLLQRTKLGYWRTHVQEQLAFQMSDKSDALDTYLNRQWMAKESQLHAEAADFIFAERFRQQSVLQGRLFDLRYCIHADIARVPDDQRKVCESLRRAIPVLSQNAEKLRSGTAQYSQAAKYDTRKWTEEELKRWDNLQKLSLAQESMLWTHAISPVAIPANFPPKLDWNKTKSLLRDDDAVIVFVQVGETLRGILYNGGNWNSWTVSTDWQKLVPQALQLIREGAPVGQPALHKTLDELRKLLVPEPDWKKMQSAKRWIIVPDGDLWMLPFELLPMKTAREFAPALSSHPITYLPTLGSATLLLRPSSDRGMPVILESSSFWSSKQDVLRLLGNRLQAIPHRAIINATAIQHAPSSRCLKSMASSYVSFLNTPWSDPNSLLVGLDKIANQGSLAVWNQLPWGTPSQIWLFGSDYTFEPTIPTGEAWRKVLLSLVAQGTDQILISRWPVGGESSMILAELLTENSISGIWSEAWQRSVAGLWSEELNLNNEQIRPQNAAGERVSGTVPVYWSSYIPVGDNLD